MEVSSLQGFSGRMFTNWAKTYQCQPNQYFRPTNRQEIAEILKMATSEKRRVRVLGKGHSPSDLPFTPDYLIVMTSMNKVLQINQKKCTIQVEAGAELADINSTLAASNISLSVLGSIDDITIGGAINTGTHGTGAEFGSLSTYVLEMELMRADGEVLLVSPTENEQLFRAACLGLGCLGVVLTVTLQCERAFYLHKALQPAPLEKVLDHLDDHLKRSDHFRFTWFPYAEAVVEHASRMPEKRVISDAKASWFWDYLIGFHLLQVLIFVSTFITNLVPYINRAYYRLLYSSCREWADVSHRMFTFECLFNQYVEEWAIPIENTGKALRELRSFIEEGRVPAHFPVEVRFVKGDNLMLSPCTGRDSCYINIVMYRPFGRTVDHEKYFRGFEELMSKNGGRPHWAKDHGVTAGVFAKIYPEWTTFCEIRKKMDPENMFINRNLERVFGSYL